VCQQHASHWLAGLAGLGFLVAAVGQAPVFVANARLVLVDVGVAETESGRTLTDLVSENFAVEVDGSPRSIALFETRARSLDVVLAVDTSGRIGRRDSNSVGDPIRELIAELRPGDRLGIVSFSNNVRIHTPLTDDEDLAENAVTAALSVRDFTRTSQIYEAVKKASGLFERRQNGSRQRVIVVVTHNTQRPDPKAVRSASEAAWEADATVIGAVVPQAEVPGARGSGVGVFGGPEMRRENQQERRIAPDLASVDPVAESTGGEVLRTSSGESSFRSVVDRLRASYRLGFYVSGEKSGFHSLKIRLSPQRAARIGGAVTLRHRSGFFLN
jgi:VWFA-related protein